MADYTAMWSTLGIDLPKHDMLLNALGDIYSGVFMSQKNRPQAMGYFDFVISEVHGLRIKELVDAKENGAKVVGTYCIFVPEDLVLAAGAIPVGLCGGAQFSVPEAEEVLPRSTCALIKSSFGFKTGRTCPYVQVSDLIVGETTCDGKKKMYELLADLHPVYVMEVPQKKTGAGLKLFEQELHDFVARLEEVTGKTVTAGDVEEQIRRIEGKKAAMARLAALRKARPVPISGLDALLVNQISFYDDVTRFTQQVNALCDELDTRVQQGEGIAPAEAPRILVSGSPMAIPNWKLHMVLEASGAVVIGEESCVGSRYFTTTTPAHEVSLTSQIEAIARRQLDTHCACFTRNDERLVDIGQMAKDLDADGIVHYGLQFCGLYSIEAVKVEREMAKLGVPVLRVETDYADEDMGQLRTRAEAFLEMVRA